MNPTPGPYYVLETVRNPKITGAMWSTVTQDYVRVEGSHLDNTIVVNRRWDDQVRPGSAQTFGSGDGALIAEFPFTVGVPSREQALANALALVRASKADDFAAPIPVRDEHRIPEPELDD